MAEVVRIDPTNFELQTYEAQDSTLINQFDVDSALTSSSYIEFYIYDLNQDILTSNLNYVNYRVENDGIGAQNEEITQFTISPEEDVTSQGFDQGEYVAYYNFLTKRIGDQFTNLYISEISSDRTEIRLDSTILSNLDIVEQTNQFIQFREDQTYFVDFYLNFGDNQLVIANNIQLENETTDDPTILVKLYEPLPAEFNLKSLLWIVTTLNEPEAFQVTYPIVPVTFSDFNQIAGPNFNIPIKGQVNNSSQLLSENDIISGAPTSSMDQIESLLNEKSLNISVDYTDFSDFVHFSSAKTRLENFYYKASLIEGYSASIADLTNTTGSSTSILILQNKISDIIKNFDGYDRFLYYTSGSEQTWPKTTTEPPYLLAKTGSTAVVNWLGSDVETSAYYGGMILSGSDYDNQNNDQLLKAIPEYLREDAQNEPYELFVDMVAQYYDNVWLYTKDITQKYNADNRLNSGISKDLVANAIRDFGIKLYQNNFSNSELYTAFLGLTPNGSLFPFPNITGSLPAPTGYEFVDTLISASNDVISMDDTNKSLYKRIYHNLPYLLNTKGTIAGIRALITSYGIPDTILRISEFGGKDKVNENDWDLYFNNFNYAWNTQGTNYMYTPWEVNSNFQNHPYDAPGTVELRFKTTGLPDSRVSQSLWFTTSSAGIDKALVLEYTGSYLTSGSYSGSIADPYYQYGTLKYISNPGTVNETSCSVYLPFFDGEWWSVMVRNNGFDAFDPEYIITEPVDYDFIVSEDGSTYIVRESSTTESLSRLGNISLFAANKIYNGNDGTQIGFKASSSITDSSASGSWISGSTSHFADNFTAGSTYQNFSGSMQEIRYYNVALGTTRFYDYTMNPLSTEGNTVNSSPNELTFRAALASEGLTSLENEIITQFGDFITTQDGSIYITEQAGGDIEGNSIHPKVTGSWTPIPSFATSSTYNFDEGALFSPNREYFFLDQFPAGIKNRITDKVRFEDNALPAGGDSLSPFVRVTQNTEASASYTENINYLEVAFSPQNEINDDIISQIGYFNIGDYIGDPRQRSSSAQIYPDLNALSEDYFKKYTHNYDLTDFIRLIKFFDNSLFKMIKDFVPARTSLASGLVIKQHLLERNKYPQPQVSYENKIYTGSIDMVDISGGPGGVFNEFNGLETSPSGALGLGPDNKFNITQSWSETYPTISGSVTKLHDNQDEFYDGEFSGSVILATNGELNEGCNSVKNVSPVGGFYNIRAYEGDGSDTPFYNFLNINNKPLNGYIQTLERGGSNTDIVYVKISNIDANGTNLVNSLPVLSSITLPITASTPHPTELGLNQISYEIVNRTRHQDYFLFEVRKPSSILSKGISIPEEIRSNLEYDFTGSMATDSIFVSGNGTLFPISTAVSKKVSISSSLGDNLGFYNPTLLEYELDTYSQKDIYIRISGSFNPTMAPTNAAAYGLYIIPPGSSPDITGNTHVKAYTSFFNNSSPNPSPLDLSYSAPSGSIVPGSKIQLRLISGLNGGQASLYSGTTLTITSSAATSSLQQLPIEPYLTSKFQNSDCDVLQGQATEARLNPFLQDLDYQTSQTVPVNYDVVVEGSASRAAVPESYYTALSQINNRYLGSKNQSIDFNVYQPLGFGGQTTTDFRDPINIGTYGQTPSVTISSNFIVYFKTVSTFNYSGGKKLQRFEPSYLVTPNENLLEITSDPLIIEQLQQAFNPIPFPSSPFGNPTGSLTFKAVSFSPTGSYVGDYTGIGSITTGSLGEVFLEVLFDDSGGFKGLPSGLSYVRNSGGLVFSTSIEFSENRDLPSKAREILAKNNLI